jgi:diguanylate cyclase (GGDEF)-like protein
MTIQVKEPLIAQDDIWNAISFGIVAIATTVFTMSIKIRAISQSRQIEYLSQTDLLTGVKNRNHYENRLEGYPDLCSSTLICVYADVNGLHEINNSAGHPAGDKMLQEVAEVMLQCFGPEHTYRIGGDEFVCLCPDVTEHVVREKVGQIAARLAEQNYFISTGVACQAKEELDMTALTAIAENEMYRAKRAFYAQAGRDRRRRREDQ